MGRLPVSLDTLLMRTKTELKRQRSTECCLCSEAGRAERQRTWIKAVLCVCLLGILLCVWYPRDVADTVKEKSICLCCSHQKCITHETTCLLFTQLHLIHWNSTLFGSIDEAVGKPHGIAIIALFVQVNDLLPWLLYCSEMLTSNSFADYFVFSLNFTTSETPCTENTGDLKRTLDFSGLWESSHIHW